MVQRTYSRGRIGPTKTRRTRAVSALHPVTEETAEWRPGVTVESRAVLTALRRLPVQSLDPEGYVFAKSEGKPVGLGHRAASVLLRVYARWMPQEYDAQGQPSATPAQPANAFEVREQLETAG